MYINARACFTRYSSSHHALKMYKSVSKRISNTVFSVFIALTAYISSGNLAQAQDIKGDAANGKAKNAMCIGCHGIVGLQASFPEIHKVPKISGQSGAYIVAALQAYKNGDRKHPPMRGIAKSLTEQDIHDLAAFYTDHGVDNRPALGKQPNIEPNANVEALLKKGGCVACHGENYAKPIAAAYPKIAGQHADYLYVALKAYKTEKNPVAARNNPVMVGMVKQYSLSELKEISKYIGSLNGDLVTISQTRFK